MVILQTASHEAAHLHIAADGVITGPEEAHSRLASVFQKSMRWYTAAALLMACIVPAAGFIYFRHNAVKAVSEAPVQWVLPWLFVIFASCCTFQIDPIFSFLEG